MSEGNFLRLGKIEIEIISEDEDLERKSEWKDAVWDLEQRGLRLPTIKELEYIHDSLYMKRIGNMEEGAKYWSSEDNNPGYYHPSLGSHKAYRMTFFGNKEASSFNSDPQRYRGVRDL
jgi:hypothetical protein